RRPDPRGSAAPATQAAAAPAAQARHARERVPGNRNSRRGYRSNRSRSPPREPARDSKNRRPVSARRRHSIAASARAQSPAGPLRNSIVDGRKMGSGYAATYSPIVLLVDLTVLAGSPAARWHRQSTP